MRDVTASILRDRNYRVEEAADGEAALAILDRLPAVDLVLADFAMPGMNGADLARHLQDQNRAIPVLFVTGYADAASLVGLSEDQIVKKPFEHDELENRVAQAIARAREDGQNDHEENGLGLSLAALQHLLRCIVAQSRQTICARQVDADLCALAMLCLNLQTASRLLDKAERLAETKSRTLSDLLGGKERFKTFRQHFVRHSRAVILHEDHDVLALGRLFRAHRATTLHVAGCNEDGSADLDRVPRIQCKIQNDQLQLGRIDECRPNLLIELSLRLRLSGAR